LLIRFRHLKIRLVTGSIWSLIGSKINTLRSRLIFLNSHVETLEVFQFNLWVLKCFDCLNIRLIFILCIKFHFAWVNLGIVLQYLCKWVTWYIISYWFSFDYFCKFINRNNMQWLTVLTVLSRVLIVIDLPEISIIV
jgi:hypothetical protein